MIKSRIDENLGGDKDDEMAVEGGREDRDLERLLKESEEVSEYLRVDSFYLDSPRPH